MIQIDTGERQAEVRALSASVDETQQVRITTRARAVTITNKMIKAIQSHECPYQLDIYWQREDLILDALHLFDTNVTAYLADLYTEHRAALIHGGAYKSAQAVPQQTASATPPAQYGNHDKETGNEF
jgi:hypothetical protein